MSIVSSLNSRQRLAITGLGMVGVAFAVLVGATVGRRPKPTTPPKPAPLVEAAPKTERIKRTRIPKADVPAPVIPEPEPQQDQPVNLNSATEAEIAGVKYVTPQMARAIVEYRDQHGRISSLEELLSLRGFGERKIRQFAPYVVLF